VKKGKQPLTKVKKFIPPTLEEVTAYCTERNNNINPQSFIDHYETRNWIPKGYTQQMKSWQAAIRTWEGNNKASPNRPKTFAEIREENNERALAKAIADIKENQHGPDSGIQDPQGISRDHTGGPDRQTTGPLSQHPVEVDSRRVYPRSGEAGDHMGETRDIPITVSLFGSGPDAATEKRRAESLAATRDP
jgi:hypothetical protein